LTDIRGTNAPSPPKSQSTQTGVTTGQWAQIEDLENESDDKNRLMLVADKHYWGHKKGKLICSMIEYAQRQWQ
jgi:hypothetical protein